MAKKNAPKTRFGVMLDCSRNAVPTVEYLKTFIDDIAAMGYNALELYTEETYEIEGEPNFGYLRGRFTKDELKALDDYAYGKGVELIPCIQTLAHLGCALRRAPYCFHRDIGDILLVDDERTYALIEKMFQTCRECFRSDVINIGMDEAHNLGLGKYLELHGYQNRFDILLSHLNRVTEIAKKYGFSPMMWSDMFFRLANKGNYYTDGVLKPDKEILDKIPENVSLCYWDYYHNDPAYYRTMIASHFNFGREVWFAGGAWSWGGFTPGNFKSMDANVASMTECKNAGVKNVLITMWGDDGAECSRYGVYPALYHASMLYRGITDKDEIRKGFYDLFGVSFDDFLLLDSANAPENHPTFDDFHGTEETNPSKYMLYNDVLLGEKDYTVLPAREEEYRESTKKLLEVAYKAGRFSYVFTTQAKLCDVLSDKYTLGVKLRAAYKAGDKKTLRALTKVSPRLRKKVSAFYTAFRTQWFNENKPHGFEVQDARLGGLMLRLSHAEKRLNDYLAGKLKNLPELEETILAGFDDPSKNECSIYFNNYAQTITTGVF